jgi:hypothetical protein
MQISTIDTSRNDHQINKKVSGNTKINDLLSSFDPNMQYRIRDRISRHPMRIRKEIKLVQYYFYHALMAYSDSKIVIDPNHLSKRFGLTSKEMNQAITIIGNETDECSVVIYTPHDFITYYCTMLGLQSIMISNNMTISDYIAYVINHVLSKSVKMKDSYPHLITICVIYHIIVVSLKMLTKEQYLQAIGYTYNMFSTMYNEIRKIIEAK